MNNVFKVKVETYKEGARVPTMQEAEVTAICTLEGNILCRVNAKAGLLTKDQVILVSPSEIISEKVS